MNAMRLLAVGAIVCLLSAGARADEKADTAKKIVGKWEVTKSEAHIEVGTAVEFTKDGKIKVSHKMGDKDMMFEGTYMVEKDSFTMVIKAGDQEHKQTITIKKITDTEMSTTDPEGKVVELKRKK